ncbi:MAG: DoxX family protein [Bacteroidetes bacterium]|nr:MAG: DoxX family protein [Bacteroidota bacterium]
MTDFHFYALFLMAAIYIFAGYSHFRNPKFFLKITPRWVPQPERVNLLVGGIEIILGLGLLFSATRNVALWGIIALLIAVFPANVYHFQKAREKGTHVLATALRLPVQGLLIWWAWSYL